MRSESPAFLDRLVQRQPDLNDNQLDVAGRFGATMGINGAGGDAAVERARRQGLPPPGEILVPKHHYAVGRRRRQADAAQTVQSKKFDPNGRSHTASSSIASSTHTTLFLELRTQERSRSSSRPSAQGTRGTGCARIEIIGVRLLIRSRTFRQQSGQARGSRQDAPQAALDGHGKRSRADGSGKRAESPRPQRQNTGGAAHAN
jgi:hypothetical protein